MKKITVENSLNFGRFKDIVGTTSKINFLILLKVTLLVKGKSMLLV